MSALCHLSVIAASEDRHDEVDSLVQRALEISPKGDAVLWMRALRAWDLDDREAQAQAVGDLRGASDFAAARATWFVALPSIHLEGPLALAELLTEPTRSREVRAVGHAWLAHLELARGRWSDAQARLAELRALHPAAATAYRALLSLSPFLEASAAELEGLRDAVSAWQPRHESKSVTPGAYFSIHDNLYPQLRAYLLGVLSARLGDPDAARLQTAVLEGSGGRPEASELACDQARSVEAHVTLQAGRRAEALAKLEEARFGGLFELTIASPFFSQAYERFSRAQLLEAEGRSEEALLWYGSFAEQSIYDLIYLAPSHIRRAAIYERLGQPEKAARHYREFADLWRDCDPRFRGHVDAALQRLQALGAETADAPGP